MVDVASRSPAHRHRILQLGAGHVQADPGVRAVCGPGQGRPRKDDLSVGTRRSGLRQSATQFSPRHQALRRKAGAHRRRVCVWLALARFPRIFRQSRTSVSAASANGRPWNQRARRTFRPGCGASPGHASTDRRRSRGARPGRARAKPPAAVPSRTRRRRPAAGVSSSGVMPVLRLRRTRGTASGAPAQAPGLGARKPDHAPGHNVEQPARKPNRAVPKRTPSAPRSRRWWHGRSAGTAIPRGAPEAVTSR